MLQVQYMIVDKYHIIILLMKIKISRIVSSKGMICFSIFAKN